MNLALACNSYTPLIRLVLDEGREVLYCCSILLVNTYLIRAFVCPRGNPSVGTSIVVPLYMYSHYIAMIDKPSKATPKGTCFIRESYKQGMIIKWVSWFYTKRSTKATWELIVEHMVQQSNKTTDHRLDLTIDYAIFIQVYLMLNRISGVQIWGLSSFKSIWCWIV